jgi:anti-sigma regulatory factor (Ser/Thr protein kinase)/23S rRNA pseudoU1915 N3-methylase RlmH
MASEKEVEKSQSRILDFHRTLTNKDLAEDAVLADIKKNTGIFFGLKKNIAAILDYAFTEMLNNAIEHSRSKVIFIKFRRHDKLIKFEVKDSGVGIFNNIMGKRHLKNIMEAIQDLLKGKQTTSPKAHSGEGVFFTSKVADILTILSGNKQLVFNNRLDDVFITDIKNRQGTKVVFTVNKEAKCQLKEVFDQYAGRAYEFAKTKVAVKLYELGDIYVSRSQARRILAGLEKFKIITLDFRGVKTVGQSFADEIFRVWQKNHPQITIEFINSNENIDLMINRARQNKL